MQMQIHGNVEQAYVNVNNAFGADVVTNVKWKLKESKFI